MLHSRARVAATRGRIYRNLIYCNSCSLRNADVATDLDDTCGPSACPGDSGSVNSSFLRTPKP